MSNKNYLIKIVKPGTFSILNAFLLSILLFGSYFFDETKILPNNTSDTFFFNLLVSQIINYPFLSFFLSFVLILLISFLLFECNEKYSLIRVRTMVPSLTFLFLMLVSDYKIDLNSGIFACFFLLMAVWLFLSTYQEIEPVTKIFNTFFFLSLGSFFYFDLLLFVPVFWISFSILRMASLRTYLSSIIALLVPYIIVLPILFVQGSFFEYIDTIKTQMNFSFELSGLETYEILYGIFLLLFFLISFLYFQMQINFDKIKTRQMMSFIFFLSFSVFVLCLFKLDFFQNIFPLLAMFLSLILGHYFSLNNSRFSVFCLALFVIVNLSFFFFI